jgi:hypothetical protein
MGRHPSGWRTGERVSVEGMIEIVDLSRLELEASLSAGDSTQAQVGQQAAILRIEGNPQPNARNVTTQARRRRSQAGLSEH